VAELNKKYGQLEKKHKELAEAYFNLKRQHKQKNNSVAEESEKLRKTYAILNEKIESALCEHEKESKAEQALIFRKSEDFQEDYKARMRAKERNLQSLKESYEKMQQIYIEEVRKLEATLERAKYQLQDAEEREKLVVEELREQLKE
jgi:hypothetical protein